MRTISVSRRTLRLTAVVVVGVGVALALLIGGIVGAGGDEAAAGPSDVEAAAAHALGEALRFDCSEGQEAWAERVRPLCTEAGWSFWNLVGVQMWPQVMETQYAVQEIEVLGSRVVETTDTAVTVEVTLRVGYVKGGEAVREEQSYRVVMVERDGRWLMDLPPDR